MTDPNLFTRARSRPARRPLGDEVDNEPFVALLVERGFQWPIGGYGPGLYAQRCRACGRSHTADKGAWHCLPCAPRSL